MRPPPKIRVLLAGGDGGVLQGLRTILEGHDGIQVVGETDDGRPAHELVGLFQPDVLVLEVTRSWADGAEVAQGVITRHPGTRVLAVSMARDGIHVGGMLRAGARGYLLKDDVENDLVSAVRGVALGLAFLSPDVIGVVLEDWRKAI